MSLRAASVMDGIGPIGGAPRLFERPPESPLARRASTWVEGRLDRRRCAPPCRCRWSEVDSAEPLRLSPEGPLLLPAHFSTVVKQYQV